MIFFVTGQYAGAEYLEPLIKQLILKKNNAWKILATGASRKHWDFKNLEYVDIESWTEQDILNSLDQFNPELIVLSTSAHEKIEFEIIQKAKKLNIKTASFIDVWTNYHQRFFYEGKALYPDFILSIDQKCSEEMVRAGIPSELIYLIGQPYLETLIQNMPEAGDNLLVVGQPAKKHLGGTLGYSEHDLYLSTKELLENLAITKYMISIHPDEEPELINEYFDEDHVKIGDGVKDIEISHTLIGMYSMQLIVGFLWGRKVASFQPNLKCPDPFPLSRWGLVPRLNSYQELEDYISNEQSDIDNTRLLDSINGSLDRLYQFCYQNSQLH